MDMDEFLAKAAERVKRLIKPYPFFEDDLKEALSSPYVHGVTPFDAAYLLRVQDSFCERCGECCRQCTPINIAKVEAKTIASYMHVPYKKFRRKCRLIPLNDGTFKMPAAPCPFLKGKLCSIYPVRPFVCRVFPAGAFISDMVEGKTNVEAPLYCGAIQQFFALKIVGLMMSLRIEREAPSIAVQLKREGERLFTHAPVSTPKEVFIFFRQLVEGVLP